MGTGFIYSFFPSLNFSRIATEYHTCTGYFLSFASLQCLAPEDRQSFGGYVSTIKSNLF